MFKDNESTRKYWKLIGLATDRAEGITDRRKIKAKIGYVEKHHAIPTSIGGSNDISNLVWLTAAEHLHAHVLLASMCEDVGHHRKMLMAAMRMINPQNKIRAREIELKDILDAYDPEVFKKIREEAALHHSAYMKIKHSGKNNPFYGKKHTPEFKQKQREKQAGVPKSEGHNRKVSLGRLKVSDKISALVTGEKNPRYNPTVYEWENIFTGETKTATRLEMVRMDARLKSNISSVILGRIPHIKGWRIVSSTLNTV
jgi:hypothetical protein